MLAEISAKVSDINANITNMEARTGVDQEARIDMTVEIRDVKHLEKGDQVHQERAGRLGSRANRPRLGSLWDDGDNVDFDARREEARDLDGGASRRRIHNEPAINGVHCPELLRSARRLLSPRRVRILPRPLGGELAIFRMTCSALRC